MRVCASPGCLRDDVRVKSAALIACRSLPVFPDKQRSSGSGGISRCCLSSLAARQLPNGCHSATGKRAVVLPHTNINLPCVFKALAE